MSLLIRRDMSAEASGPACAAEWEEVAEGVSELVFLDAFFSECDEAFLVIGRGLYAFVRLPPINSHSGCLGREGSQSFAQTCKVVCFASSLCYVKRLRE